MRPSRLAIPAVVALLALGGCSSLFGPPESPIKVGECSGPLTGTTVSKIPTVSCATAHNWEAYAHKNVADSATYPGVEAMKNEADAFCSAEFVTVIGTSYDDSDLDLQMLYPIADSWAKKDREIICLVGLDAGGITGSLKGTQR